MVNNSKIFLQFLHLNSQKWMSVMLKHHFIYLAPIIAHCFKVIDKNSYHISENTSSPLIASVMQTQWEYIPYHFRIHGTRLAIKYSSIISKRLKNHEWALPWMMHNLSEIYFCEFKLWIYRNIVELLAIFHLAPFIFK